MPALLPLFIAIVIIALQPYDTTAALAATTLSEEGINFHDVDYTEDEPCDDSFPLAPTPSRLLHQQHLSTTITTTTTTKSITTPSATTLKVTIPNDPTRRLHAPLCPDGHHINIRLLENCPGGTCWVPNLDQCFHATSRECNTPIATPQPSRRPTFGLADTVHPVALVLKDVPVGYRPNAEIRSLILRFVTETLEESLSEDGLELVMVEYAGRLPPITDGSSSGGNGGIFSNKDGNRVRKLSSRFYLRRGHPGQQQQRRRRMRQRRLDAVSIPLRVTVNGPTNINDLALSYIMDAIRERFGDLENRLRRLDGDVYSTVDVGMDTYEFDMLLTGPTNSPSDVPTTGRPTRMPSRMPSTVPSEAPSDVIVDTSDVSAVIMDDTTTGGITSIPWWVWLVIVLVLLLLCIFCRCCCMYRKKKNAEKGKNAVNVYVQNGNAQQLEKMRRAPPPLPPQRQQQQRPQQRQQQQRQQQQRPPPRRDHRLDESENPRASRHPPPRPRPAVTRHISQTELEEETREKEYMENRRKLEEEEARLLRKREQRDPSTERTKIITSNVLVVHEAVVSLDPPEENSLVVYSSNINDRRRQSEDIRSYASEEPEGLKVPKMKSMFASDVYLNSDDGSHPSSDESRSVEDPEGYKIPKQKSTFANTHAYSNSSPVISDDSGHGGKRRSTKKGVYPKKDAMFLCSWEELPEEVQSKTRSSTAERNGGDGRKKKKKKSKKKQQHRSAVPQNIDTGGDDDRLQHDESHEFDDEIVFDSWSIATQEPREGRAVLKGRDDHHTKHNGRGGSSNIRPLHSAATARKHNRDSRASAAEKTRQRHSLENDEDGSEEEDIYGQSLDIAEL